MQAAGLTTVGLVAAGALAAIFAAVALARAAGLNVANVLRLAALQIAEERKNGEWPLLYAARTHIISLFSLPLGVRVDATLQTQLEKLELFGSCRFLLYFLLHLNVRLSVRHGSWMVENCLALLACVCKGLILCRLIRLRLLCNCRLLLLHRDLDHRAREVSFACRQRRGSVRCKSFANLELHALFDAVAGFGDDHDARIIPSLFPTGPNRSLMDHHQDLMCDVSANP